MQQRADAWRNANPDKTAQYNSTRLRDPSDLAAYSWQRRADPAKYAHDLELSRDRRRLIRGPQAQGLPPPQLQKTTAAERRTNGTAAREFFTRARIATQRRDLTKNDDSPPTAQELQDAARDRSDIRPRAERQQHISNFMTRHGERIRREIELDSRARQIRGAAPLSIDAELVKRVRALPDSYNKTRQLGQPHQAKRADATPSKDAAISDRQNNTDLSR